ncbi:prepilin peptidase [Pelagimonas phthalicica]|uniref:prepilin peptidase n=1 Tax=Pelagimonas phthalicica TaxID=1037362 RepID=UPI001AAE8D1C|nr:A24 family peptidase [Pelagimonas phthalicica]
MAIWGAGSGWPALIFAMLLVWVSMADWDSLEIPDSASALLVLSGVSFVLTTEKADLADHLFGGVFWPLAFWLISSVYLRARKVHGLGLGDVKLMAGIGVWCGFLGTIWVVLGAALSALSALTAFRLLRIRKGLRQQLVAFGPFLCFFAWYVWVTRTVV